ncbi:MAG: SufE family protein [Bacteroidetes bacterium]|jgi:cysteine desulfuration protein SufE|nr:SufE family protein [Bacteroidota bacterium]MBT3421192.1 SufE family protein [Bacteroidota bacterium]MBT3934851.1 SufE family protein [Bacteroidota bacterium]MBT4727058.1 SufE family protein [Bacteroidota bacterium]MBT4967538.1 SufE family protein [Bacteroidota bacterium]
MSIEDIKNEVIEEFAMFDDWMDRYDHLIEQGKSLIPMDIKHKNDSNLIKGCQSQVWLHAYLDNNGNLIFEADSDAIITKGLIALLIRVFSGNKPSEVEEASVNFLDQIGLKEQLSPTRSNGLFSMIKQMKIYAIAFQAKK